ncbi:MAG: NAD(+) synthase [Nanoarchaeota archaeon]|mgnify:CR=1 FL=1
MTSPRFALAQMEVVSDPERNVETIIRFMEQAAREGATAAFFPEMAIKPYMSADDWVDDDYCLDAMSYDEDIRKESARLRMAVAYGNIYVDDAKNIDDRLRGTKFESRFKEIHPNPDGRTRKYNAVRIFQDGEPAKRLVETPLLPPGVQPKTLLPTYRVFDDERYFFSLRGIADEFDVSLESLLQPYLIRGDDRIVPVGFVLCEDWWCEDYRRKRRALNPTKILIENGAEFISNSSTSPWTFGKNDARDRRVLFLKEDSGDKFVPSGYVNCAGAQNNGKDIITLDGGSTVYNAQGKPILLSEKHYARELLVVDDLCRPPLKRVEEPKIAQKNAAIVEGIRHMKEITGLDHQPKYIIGLSGGIDSSVVAALLVQAVGKDKVLGFNMPYKDFNSKETRETAKFVADALGIPYIVVPIDEMVDVNSRILENISILGNKRVLTANQAGNVQAKIRGTNVLSNLAAIWGALFTNNGNKLEIALGYATLYGDVNGALAPIGDCTKTEVVQMARYLNETVFRKTVIPDILMPDSLWRFKEGQIQPSAELEKDRLHPDKKQVDPMRFGYHCALIESMLDYKRKSMADVASWYLEGTLEAHLGISTDLIRRWDIDKPSVFLADLEWFCSTVVNNYFKRVQTCPIIVTSKTAFGFDNRERLRRWKPTRKYSNLRAEVVALNEYRPKEYMSVVV